ncbi:MAG: UDP-3-O-[3-hydroxymyristoyl] N-acetylglucosamine deacetylase [Proteobacteria bacterium]|nr:UDP-3-O-[3-hydroxymyristoyl] N-acetylglucosamine deacetylase [Pseudomonadota bacterium]
MINSTAVGKLENKGLILVVDDEDTICSTLTSVLEDENYTSITANNGLDAVLKVKSFNPDVVFLDIWMPESDGIETLETIKSISPHTPVIMISGHATISNALEATKRGAFDFIEKPLNIESILLSTARAIEKRQQNTDKELNELARAEKIKNELSSLSHPGMNTTGLRGKNYGQRTLKQSAILYGHCLHSGQKSGLILEPLPENSGIHFSKIGDSKTVPAHINFVRSTDMATTLHSGSTSSATIEHLMAALFAYRISNLLIKCNGEVPIFDGSAIEFCKVIESVGIEEQGGEWYEIAVDKKLEYKTDLGQRKSGLANQQEEQITIEPADHFSVSYKLNYPAPIGAQYFEFKLNSADDFLQQIAPARTFGFLKDIEKLQKAGLAAGGRLDNFILIDSEKVVNTQLRFAEELARHKILDIIGDLFLLGRPLRCKITANMSGHSDNIGILRQVHQLLN